MPRKKIERSLTELCSHVVYENLKRFVLVCNSLEEPRMDFLFLQRNFSSKFLSKLKERKIKVEEQDCLKHINITLEDDYLNFLINPYLEEFDFSNYNGSINQQLLTDRLKIAGKSLTNIDLSFSKVGEDILKEIIPSLGNVERFNLRSTECTDEVLKCIALNCPLLETLDISFCENITDNGLRNLCKTDESGRIVKNYKLLSLCIRNTSYTNSGVTDDGVSFVLNNIPSLKYLEYDKLNNAMWKACAANSRNKPLEMECKYNLTYLGFGMWDDDDAIERWSSLCPNVTVLSLYVSTDEISVLSCAKFSYLEDLNLTFQRDTSFNLINELLSVIGSKLKKLFLQNCSYVCARTLADLCPRLRSLSLSHVGYISMKSKEKMPTCAFSHLTYFFLKAASLISPEPYNSVNLILSSSKKLEKFYTHSVWGLNEEIIDSVLENNPLVHLIDLDMMYGDISAASIQKFLLQNNKLQRLHLRHCNNILPIDYEILKSFINLNNYDIDFYYTKPLSEDDSE